MRSDNFKVKCEQGRREDRHRQRQIEGKEGRRKEKKERKEGRKEGRRNSLVCSRFKDGDNGFKLVVEERGSYVITMGKLLGLKYLVK